MIFSFKNILNTKRRRSNQTILYVALYFYVNVDRDTDKYNNEIIKSYEAYK